MKIFGVLFMVLALFSSTAFADMAFDLGFIDLTEGLNSGSNTSMSQYFYNLDLLFKMDSRGSWCLGWSIFDISQSETLSGGSTIAYSSMDMGPVVRWNIDHNNTYSATFAYGYYAKGTYADSSSATNQKWNGSSFRLQFAAQYPISDRWSAGASLNYYTGSYSQKVVSNVESSISASKTWLFPMISLTWRP